MTKPRAKDYATIFEYCQALEEYIKRLEETMVMPREEVICKICEKSIYRIFVEHIESHLKE